MAESTAHSQLAAYQSRLDGLDVAALTPLVRQALRRRSAVPLSWNWTPVSYAVYYPRRVLVRFQGEAALGGETVPWSAVLKIVQPPPGTEAAAGQAATATWDREVRAYRSGLLRGLPDGLAAPRVLHVAADAGGAVWLWLERVEDAFGGRWPLAQYGIAARHLGRFNGAYGTHGDARPLPKQRWLNHRWAESHSEPARLPDARIEVDALLAHPSVRATFPAAAGDRLRRLLDDQPFFKDVLAGLAQTLCHHDASSANLFARRRAPAEQAAHEHDAWETVAIDWEEIGPGPIGAEAATLVFGTLRRRAFPVHRARELEHIVLEQYQCGLRDAGWQGDPELVRLGYAAAVALRWFVVPAPLRLLAGPAARASAERAPRETAEALIRERLALLHFLLDCADDARRLARRYGAPHVSLEPV